MLIERGTFVPLWDPPTPTPTGPHGAFPTNQPCWQYIWSFLAIKLVFDYFLSELHHFSQHQLQLALQMELDGILEIEGDLQMQVICWMGGRGGVGGREGSHSLLLRHTHHTSKKLTTRARARAPTPSLKMSPIEACRKIPHAGPNDNDALIGSAGTGRSRTDWAFGRRPSAGAREGQVHVPPTAAVLDATEMAVVSFLVDPLRACPEDQRERGVAVYKKALLMRAILLQREQV